MGTLKTNEINPNIIDFLEAKKIAPELFRNIWQASEWENKLVIKKSNMSVQEFVDFFSINFKMQMVKELSTETDKFHIYCFYSRFVLGKDLLCNISLEQEGAKLVAHVKMRSQNMGVVIMVGKKLKKIAE